MSSVIGLTWIKPTWRWRLGLEGMNKKI